MNTEGGQRHSQVRGFAGSSYGYERIKSTLDYPFTGSADAHVPVLECNFVERVGIDIGYCGLDRPMMRRIILVALLALPASPGGSPWDKAPEKWNLADVSRILLDSPWCPAGVKLEREATGIYADPRPGIVSGGPVNSDTSNPVPGIQISRSKPQPKVPVIWWSSKTIRLARERLIQLSIPSLAAEPLRADEIPDYVLVIEGSEPLRVLKDAKEDLHDSVFMELTSGMTLELGSVRFIDGTQWEEPRAEFHFPRQIEGRATVDPESALIVFHCKASAKTPRPGHENALALRAEFRPRAMRVHGVPDL